MTRPFAWEQSYPPGIVWDAPIVRTSLGELLAGAVGRFGARPAIEFRGRRITYDELHREAGRFGAALIARGFRPGDALALYLPNTPYHPFAFFGAALAGVKLVHLSPLDAERELAHKLTDSGARAMVTVDVALDVEGRVTAWK